MSHVIGKSYGVPPKIPYCIGHTEPLVKQYMTGLYCPVCEREKRINKPKKTLETLGSLEAKVAKYIEQHNLHNPKNKLRCHMNHHAEYVRIGDSSANGLCAVYISEGGIQNTFNILKHRIREALSPHIDLRTDDERHRDAIQDVNNSIKVQEARRVGSSGSAIFTNMINDALEESILPTDSKERKTYPIFTGVLQYFPRAIASVANQSYKGNQKHHPDKPLHWDKAKSDDHSDCLLRHLMDSLDSNCDKTEELTAVAWRALALLETHLEDK